VSCRVIVRFVRVVVDLHLIFLVALASHRADMCRPTTGDIYLYLFIYEAAGFCGAFQLNSLLIFFLFFLVCNLQVRRSEGGFAQYHAKDILLRRTNTKLVYVFDGKVVQLDKPQIVKRGERTIEYTKVGHVSQRERPCCFYARDSHIMIMIDMHCIAETRRQICQEVHVRGRLA